MPSKLCKVHLFAMPYNDMGTRVMHRLEAGDHVHADEGYWKVESVLDSGGVQFAYVVNASKSTKRKHHPGKAPRDTLRKMRARHRRAELELLVEALEDSNWSIAKASKLLDVHRSSTQWLIKKHKLERSKP